MRCKITIPLSSNAYESVGLGEPAVRSGWRCHDRLPSDGEQELPPLLSLGLRDDAEEQGTRRSRGGRAFLLSGGSRRPRAYFPFSPSSPMDPGRGQARWVKLLPLPLLVIFLAAAAQGNGDRSRGGRWASCCR